MNDAEAAAEEEQEEEEGEEEEEEEEEAEEEELGEDTPDHRETWELEPTRVTGAHMHHLWEMPKLQFPAGSARVGRYAGRATSRRHPILHLTRHRLRFIPSLLE